MNTFNDIKTDNHFLDDELFLNFIESLGVNQEASFWYIRTEPQKSTEVLSDIPF